MGKERSKKKLVPNPEEAETVRLIYKWYVSGLGSKSITEKLNQEGYKYRGKKWQKARIIDIIGDEAYIGKYYFNKKDRKTNQLKPKKEWIAIDVEPIVDKDIWEKAKALKKERAPQTPGSNPALVTSKTLLTGLLYCEHCGARMTIESAKSGQYNYYNCSNYIRRGKSTCRGQRIPSDRIEKAILDHMANKLFTTERVKTILKGVYHEIQAMDKRNEGQRKSLTRQLTILNNKLTRQYEAIESGAIDLEDVGERIRELKKQRVQIEERLKELKPKKAIPLHFFKEESITSFQKTIRELFLGTENQELTKRYLQLFIEKIIVRLPSVEIIGKVDTVLTILENKKAVRTNGVLTAVGNWLPGTDSNRRPGG